MFKSYRLHPIKTKNQREYKYIIVDNEFTLGVSGKTFWEAMTKAYPENKIAANLAVAIKKYAYKDNTVDQILASCEVYIKDFKKYKSDEIGRAHV